MNPHQVTNRVWLLDDKAIVRHRVDLSPFDCETESVAHEFCATDARLYVTTDASRERVLATCMLAMQSGEPQRLEDVSASTVVGGRPFTCSGLVLPLDEPIRLLTVLYDLRFDDSALTPKEAEVVACLARGENPVETLDIEPSTVTTHKSNAKRKLGVENDVALGAWAARNGLV